MDSIAFSGQHNCLHIVIQNGVSDSTEIPEGVDVRLPKGDKILAVAEFYV